MQRRQALAQESKCKRQRNVWSVWDTEVEEWGGQAGRRGAGGGGLAVQGGEVAGGGRPGGGGDMEGVGGKREGGGAEPLPAHEAPHHQALGVMG